MKLAVCIPNYNRLNKLKKMLMSIIGQIRENNLYSEVEICVSDDHSSQAPDEVITDLRAQYPQIKIIYHRNEINRGMDHNFLQSVMISSGEYCWIVGNDDEPEADALMTIMRYIDENAFDILVSPFDVYDSEGAFMHSVIPLHTDENEGMCFYTAVTSQYDSLIEKVQTGDALFCFLSNVVFKKQRWIEHGDMFEDKMNTIFIQMYMNLQTLKEGAVYKYIPEKIIKNHEDPHVNETYKREYAILIGLNGVVDYFFDNKQRRKLKECMIDPRINGRMWGLPDGSHVKRSIELIDSVKNEYYRKYYVKTEERADRFTDQNIILYGAGHLGQQAAEELLQYPIGSFAVYDSDPLKWGKRIKDYQINEPSALVENYTRDHSIVVVANNLALVEIVDMLLERNVDRIAFIN